MGRVDGPPVPVNLPAKAFELGALDRGIVTLGANRLERTVKERVAVFVVAGVMVRGIGRS